MYGNRFVCGKHERSSVRLYTVQYAGISGYQLLGTLGFSSSTMTATTSSNGKNIGGYKTTLTGTLTKNGVSLGSQSNSGESKTSITKAGANGYKSGSGTHNVYYLNQTWTGYTSI